MQKKNLNPSLLETIDSILLKVDNVESIILFGSQARGEALEYSDWDVLVIANFDRNFLERLKILGRCSPIKFRAEILGYTPNEFRTMLKKYHLLALEVLHDGIAIYDTGFFKNLKAEFDELKEKGLRKTERVWIHPST